tara:strand:+ start:1497 stop:2285 length:789 start_codon:yes stop_codon:yes gene_type:complete
VIKAKKSLGQNFLVDKNILKKIVDTTDIQDKTVLEVGPGTGNLTSFILKKSPKKFFVVEKDYRLISNLKKKFKNQIEIINDDILNVNERKLSKDKLIVFGNLPFNISTEILCKWIINLEKNKFWFEKLILMFQKEVAERIIANVNTTSYGRLAILAKWKLNIKKICDIQSSSFYPKPKIDSSLLYFAPKKNFLKINNSRNIELVTRFFFNHRRKMIKKPFNQLFNGNIEIKKKLQLDLNLRPQNLDLNTYYKLAKEYEELDT